MTSLPPMSTWASARFGETTAEPVRDGVVHALLETQSNAEQAHRVARPSTLHTYGFTVWRCQFDRFVDFVGSLDGARLIKPPGSSYHLVVIGGNMLYPFRYASDLRKSVKDASLRQPVSELTHRLFKTFAKRSRMYQEELFSIELHRAVEIEGVDSLVLVPYACNADAGLLAAYWGEGTLCADGTIAWADGMPEPLPIHLPGDDGQRTPRTQPDNDGPKPFNQGEEPNLDFPRRRPGTLPSSEKDQPEPEAEGNGQP